MMQLPGGLWEQGVRRRGFRFKPVDGALELAVAEASDMAMSMPEAVTLALQCSLSELADGPPTPERLDALCVADRQFLMRELGRRLGIGGGWFSASCSACREAFDFELDFSRLPVREAGQGYPHVDLTLDGMPARFRLPNGADQAGLLAFEHETEALRWLLTRCLENVEPGLDEASFVERLDDQDLIRIEQALEQAAPEVTAQVEAGCPACGHSNRVDLNPYGVLDSSSGGMLREVHQIAYHYHWSEAEILGLSRQRRRHYLRLIDRTRGMSQ